MKAGIILLFPQIQANPNTRVPLNQWQVEQTHSPAEPKEQDRLITRDMGIGPKDNTCEQTAAAKWPPTASLHSSTSLSCEPYQATM